MEKSSSTYLYRIMPLRHLIDLLETRELYFASPNSWHDPYERVIQHKGTPWTFAQCWGKRAVSDAMWRIYSSDHMAVRIRTTRDKLEIVGKQFQASHYGIFRVDSVVYNDPKVVDTELNEIAAKLKSRFDIERALNALFLKRDAFDYEAEVRAVVYLKPRPRIQAIKNFRFQIDPHALVESILFDPRAEASFVKMTTHYLRNVLHFEGSIARSALYRASEIIIPDDA